MRQGTKLVSVKLQTVIVSEFEVPKLGNMADKSLGQQLDEMLEYYTSKGQLPNKLVVDLCPQPVADPADMSTD